MSNDIHLFNPLSLNNLKPWLHILHSLEDKGSKQSIRSIFTHSLFSSMYPVLHLEHWEGPSYVAQLGNYWSLAITTHLLFSR